MNPPHYLPLDQLISPLCSVVHNGVYGSLPRYLPGYFILLVFVIGLEVFRGVPFVPLNLWVPIYTFSMGNQKVTSMFSGLRLSFAFLSLPLLTFLALSVLSAFRTFPVFSPLSPFERPGAYFAVSPINGSPPSPPSVMCFWGH